MVAVERNKQKDEALMSRKRRTFSTCMGVLLLSLVGSVLLAAEKTVDHPIYAVWAQFNVGSSITTEKTVIKLPPALRYQRVTLVERTNDKMVLESQQKNGAHEDWGEARRTEIPA